MTTWPGKPGQIFLILAETAMQAQTVVLRANRTSIKSKEGTELADKSCHF